MVKNMNNTTYSGNGIMKSRQYAYVVNWLEGKAAEAQQQSTEYAEGEEYGESQWQDGRAAGIREALAMIYTLDPDRREYQDTRDRIAR